MQHRRSHRGEVNFVTFLVVGVITLVGWWLWLWAPLALDHVDVRQAIVESVNTASASGIDTARFRLVDRLTKQIGWHFEIDEKTGQEVKRPGLGIDPREILLEKNEETQNWEASVSYVRTIQLVPFKMRRSFHYEAMARTPIR